MEFSAAGTFGQDVNLIGTGLRRPEFDAGDERAHHFGGERHRPPPGRGSLLVQLIVDFAKLVSHPAMDEQGIQQFPVQPDLGQRTPLFGPQGRGCQ